MSNSFTKDDIGKRFRVRDDLVCYNEYGEDVFVDEMKYLMGSEFVLDEYPIYYGNRYGITKEMTIAIDTVVNDNKGGKDMNFRNVEDAKGAVVRNIDGEIIVKMPINMDILKKDMVVINDDGDKFVVKDICDGNIVIDGYVYNDLDQDAENILSSRYDRLNFVPNQKNYYVAFDYDANRYKRYSEDKIKRIDTVFLSKDNAKSLRDDLNRFNINNNFVEMAFIATELDIQIIEKSVALRYDEVEFVPNQKNYYVAFDNEAKRYKRYSEDKIRRVGTVFLSPEDAKFLRDELLKICI